MDEQTARQCENLSPAEREAIVAIGTPGPCGPIEPETLVGLIMSGMLAIQSDRCLILTPHGQRAFKELKQDDVTSAP